MISAPVYATREDVASALDFKQTARATAQIDRALMAASRGVDGLCRRVFYPEQANRSWDWPNGQTARPWRLWLDASDLLSVTEVTTGGETVPADAVLLEPQRYGPPYNQVQIDTSISSGWIGGDTAQRSISITGTYGYTDDHAAAGPVPDGIDGTSTTLTVGPAASAEIGVGNLLRLGAERVLVTGRALAATGQTLTTDIDGQAKTTAVRVSDGGKFAAGETILVGGERMHVVDIAEDTLVVRRAWDGSALAAHVVGAPVFAPRALAVVRGALGSEATAHPGGTAVDRWEPPALVHQLALGEAINTVLQEQAGWFRTVQGSSREATLAALDRLRTQTYDTHGRKARLRGV
ncbi:hypothetical protein ACWCPT_05750 [Streptomyces sp. NPDC002308]